MILNLSKDDLLHLVFGCCPSPAVANLDIVKSARFLHGNGKDKIWLWSPIKLSRLSEEELFKLYCVCRDSWDNERDKFRAMSVHDK